MSSGVKFDEDYANFNSDINRMGRVIALGNSINEFAASLESERQSGTYHHYVSMDTQVLGMVLKTTTGKTPSAYLEEKIWKKIGMQSDAKWLVDDKDMELVFGTLNVTLRDYARFGRLYINHGNWDGEQIVPEQWVIDSVKPDSPHLMPGDNPLSNSKMGYGYQWWIPEQPKSDFMALGVYGQYIYVNPKKRVVIVKTSAFPHWKIGLETNSVIKAWFQYLAEYLK
jgi:CubicO group peptidase (beta-lactamase class C family)